MWPKKVRHTELKRHFFLYKIYFPNHLTTRLPSDRKWPDYAQPVRIFFDGRTSTLSTGSYTNKQQSDSLQSKKTCTIPPISSHPSLIPNVTISSKNRISRLLAIRGVTPAPPSTGPSTQTQLRQARQAVTTDHTLDIVLQWKCVTGEKCSKYTGAKGDWPPILTK